MPDHLDFTLPFGYLTALSVGLLQPLYLYGATRIPALQGRNALQFLVSAAVALVLWGGAVILFSQDRLASAYDFLPGFFVISCCILVYLEIWGLMSRGYTLGLLLTLFEADQPLTATEILQRYRGGEGLDWIMRHRLAGMISSGVIVREGDFLKLTPLRGMVVARLYQFAILIVGLRRTG
jgi:hypothetical protein